MYLIQCLQNRQLNEFHKLKDTQEIKNGKIKIGPNIIHNKNTPDER